MPKKPEATVFNSPQLEHERLTSLINSMADGVIATTRDGSIVIYNGAALNILDINGSMQNKPIKEVLKLVDKNHQQVDALELIHSTKTSTSSRDLRLQFSDGSVINLYLSVAPVHLGYGRQGDRGYVLLLRDITHEKSLEEERDEFISVVSHELRTPIAIAEGNISNAQLILKKTGNPHEIEGALQQAHHQVVFLGDMINDLSTLSRAERGKLAVEVEPVNCFSLVNELVENYRAQAKQKGLTITAEIDPHLEILHSSTLYVREILQNFATNAIKYTEHGGVTIGAQKKDSGTLFYVHDSGIGISKSDQERVFDKFFRSEDFRTRQNNGTGLGLYVTMKLARLLHAEIELKSELNHGSTFNIFIPNLE